MLVTAVYCYITYGFVLHIPLGTRTARRFRSISAVFVTASCLLSIDSFDIHADGAITQRWRKWIKRLENLFVAADIKDKTRQSAFLLYYAEEEVCDIFETLPQSGDDFETAKEKLTEYFDPEIMSSMKLTTFSKRNRIHGESMNAYHSRWRQLASTCEFANIDKDKDCSSQAPAASLEQSDLTSLSKDRQLSTQALSKSLRKSVMNWSQWMGKSCSVETTWWYLKSFRSE